MAERKKARTDPNVLVTFVCTCDAQGDTRTFSVIVEEDVAAELRDAPQCDRDGSTLCVKEAFRDLDWVLNPRLRAALRANCYVDEGLPIAEPVLTELSIACAGIVPSINVLVCSG
jgi:hypothetical protein